MRVPLNGENNNSTGPLKDFVTELPPHLLAAGSPHLSLAHMGASSNMGASSPCFHMAEKPFHSSASLSAVPAAAAAAGEGDPVTLCWIKCLWAMNVSPIWGTSKIALVYGLMWLKDLI